jgi:hypothetical protein
LTSASAQSQPPFKRRCSPTTVGTDAGHKPAVVTSASTSADTCAAQVTPDVVRTTERIAGQTAALQVLKSVTDSSNVVYRSILE